MKPKKVLMTDTFVKSLEKLAKPHEKSKEEIAYDNAIESVKKSASMFGWNVDKAFVDLMLPVFEAYIKDASKIIDWSYKLMTKRERKYCEKIDTNSKLKPTDKYKRIKKERLAEYKAKLNEVKKAFIDMRIEDTPVWEKTWGMKEYLPTEYDYIPVEGKKGLTEMRIKPEFVKNKKANYKISKYNAKRFAVCHKWRQEQLHWFIDNLRSLWH